MRRCVVQIAVLSLCVPLWGVPWASGREKPAPGQWLTGPALDEQLQSVVSVSWSNSTISRALASLRQSQHVAIVLDRRVDPDRPLQLDLPREPLTEVLRKVAQQARLGYCQLGPVAYFGPGATAARLRTLVAARTEQARGLASGKRLLERRSAHWSDLAEPREILRGWAAEAGVELGGQDRIPHDLWPAADLPSMSWIERATLLTAQFDLAFQIVDMGARVELVSMPARATIARSYRVRGSPEAVARQWSAELPNADVAVAAGGVRVEGSLEDHEIVAHKLRGASTRPATSAAGKEVYQVSIESTPLARVVEQLAERLNLDFTWDRAAIDRSGISIDQPVSLKVADADTDELLRAVFKGTGLTFARTGRSVRIQVESRQ